MLNGVALILSLCEDVQHVPGLLSQHHGGPGQGQGPAHQDKVSQQERSLKNSVPFHFPLHTKETVPSLQIFCLEK